MEYISEHRLVIDAINNGENVFLTGVGGSGKSYLIRTLSFNTTRNYVICGTTGVSALNVQGETIHRFMKLGVNCRPEELKKVIAKWYAIKSSDKPWDRKCWNLMQRTDGIVIDEISMFRRDQFELLDNVMRIIFKNDKPFGGKQVILVGDFCQLPPVVKDEDLIHYQDLNKPYVFQSSIWEEANFRCFHLTTSYRQTDTEFLNALNEVRVGIVSDKTDEMLWSRVNAKLDTDVKPIVLYPTNKNVQAENLMRLNKLPGKKHSYPASYTGNNYDVEALKKDCVAEDSLVLCENAQVMMLANDPKNRWVNGSIGIIEKIDQYIHVRIDGVTHIVEPYTWERLVPEVGDSGTVERKAKATMSQYPMKLAFSITLHKSQGATLQYAKMNLVNAFAPGQAYVALSRVKSLDGLTLTSWDKKCVFADPAVLDFYGIKTNTAHNVVNKFKQDVQKGKISEKTAAKPKPKLLFDMDVL